MKSFAFSVLSIAFLSLLVSCETTDSGPEPEREKLSSMPHNFPQPWEGQAGMPGQMGGY
jgi:hypothetical protein